MGAKNDLQEIYGSYHLLLHQQPSSSLTGSLGTASQSVPGFWEAAVKSTKYNLKRVIVQQCLDYEEFATITAKVEACLNSCPLCSTTSHSPDSILLLTPGHFLIGHALPAYLETTITADPSLFKRCTLCQAVIQHFWRRWSGEYLQQLQKAGKWHTIKPNL